MSMQKFENPGFCSDPFLKSRYLPVFLKGV